MWRVKEACDRFGIQSNFCVGWKFGGRGVGLQSMGVEAAIDADKDSVNPSR